MKSAQVNLRGPMFIDDSHETHPRNLEVTILRCCARVALDSRSEALLQRLLQEKIDWEKLLRLAHEHGLSPLLWSHLSKICPESMPETYRHRLRDYFRNNSIRNHYLKGELLRLLELFAASNIPAIPFKGVALAISVYGDLALRHFGDLDILVRPRDVARAKALLIEQGYEQKAVLTTVQEAKFVRHYYHHTFSRVSDGVLVELHWDVAPKYFSFPFAEMRLWDRAGTISLNGAQTLAPEPEDLLLLLCLHGTRHLWNKLELICGVAELVRSTPSLNWEVALGRARALGSRRMLLLGLALARELLWLELPAEIQREIEAERALAKLVARVRREMFEGAGERPGPFARNLYHVRARERFRDQARYWLLFSFTPGVSEWWWLPLPRPLSFLYYLIRPALALRQYQVEFNHYWRRSR